MFYFSTISYCTILKIIGQYFIISDKADAAVYYILRFFICSKIRLDKILWFLGLDTIRYDFVRHINKFNLNINNIDFNIDIIN